MATDINDVARNEFIAKRIRSFQTSVQMNLSALSDATCGSFSDELAGAFMRGDYLNMIEIFNLVRSEMFSQMAEDEWEETHG